MIFFLSKIRAKYAMVCKINLIAQFIIYFPLTNVWKKKNTIAAHIVTIFFNFFNDHGKYYNK